MPIYTFVLKVNTVDVASYGFYVGSMSGNWNAPTLSYDEVAIPGADGSTATTTTPTLSPLDFTVIGELIGTSSSDFETKLDTFKQALSASTLTLIGGNHTTRQRTGQYVGPMLVEPYPMLDAAKVQFTVRCRNPIAYDATNTTVSGASGVDVTCALGTWHSRPIFTIAGATNPTLTYKNASGSSVATLSVSGTGTLFVIDASAMTITANGVRHDEYVSAGDFFALDPRDGVYGSTNPSVRTSSGTLSATYPKAWL